MFSGVCFGKGVERRHFWFACRSLLVVLSSVLLSAQTPLTSNSNHPGTIAAGGSSSFSFSANSGESIILRVGATNFVPKIELFGPNGALVSSSPATTPSGGVRDVVLTNQLTASGTFTVSVSSYFNGGAGAFGLYFVHAPGSFSVPTGDEGGAMVNGARQIGNLTLGDLDMWSFTGNAGDSITLRMGGTNLVPRLDLYGPNGALVRTEPATAPSGGVRDVELKVKLSSSGSFTVVASSYYSGNIGGYSISLAQAPGAVAVSPGDEGGPLTNGVRHVGNIDLGEVDSWSFTGNAGDGIQLRMGATNLVPRIDLYDGNGTLVASEPSAAPSGGIRDASLATQLSMSGTFTVVVSSYYSGGTGGYSLTLAQAPGDFVILTNDEGGPVQNGARNPAQIDLGDLDMWRFTANAGDNIQLRVGATTFVPRLDLYGPTGALLVSSPNAAPSGGTRDTGFSFKIAAAGTYTVVASSYYMGGVGDYSLTLTRVPDAIVVSPGDEGGPLTNGFIHTGELDVGDLDVWSFSGNSGNSVQLRMSGTNLVPRIDLYGPDGTLIGSQPATTPSGGTRDVVLTAELAATGTYTVVVSSYYPNADGGYGLSFARVPDDLQVSPGDEGGALTNGWLHVGALALGDFDTWTFSGVPGSAIHLRMGATNLVSRIDLYGPDGALIETAPATQPSGGTRDVLLTNRLAAAGTYYVVVSSYYSGGAGGYSLSLAEAPGEAFVALGDEGGSMVNGYTYRGTNSLGDIDVWTFYGTVGDSNVFRIGTVDFTPWLRLFDSSGQLVKEALTVGTAVRTNQMSYVVTNNGVYTLVSQAYYGGQSGTYNLKQSRVPPDINMPGSVTIDEGAVLNVPISAQDPDEPNKSLTFLLQAAPAGVTMSSLGATNATILWTTTEADGPSTNTFLVTVTDVVNGTAFTRTNTFTVVINEVNVAPVLTVVPDAEVDELAPLTIAASATDVDLPKNPLTFSLLSPPPGMSIDPASGAISWTPTESQGAGTYTVGVVVTDDSPSAVNAQHLSATNTLSVTVREINLPPQVVVADQSIEEGKPFTLPVIATDPDDPANVLSFSLLTPPPGLSVSPATGVISWTPTEAQGPSTNTVSVVVTDSNPDAVNDKQLSTTATFRIVVTEVNSQPVFGTIAPQTLNELSTLTVTNSATDADLPANSLTYTLVAPPAGATIDANGVITWTPTEAQGPATNTFTTIVTDNGTPALTATNSFTVVVSEVNSAPEMTLPGSQAVDELKAVSLAVTATDADLPQNVLTFSLIAPPAGMTINPSSGQITWTPTEVQGPSTNAVTVVVTDNGSPAASVTNSFTLTVNEVNSAPVIADIAPQSVHFGTLLTVPTLVTDEDLPTNSISLALEGAPEGMTLVNGVITWTPAEAQLGNYNVTVRATDNGTPAMSATKSVQVTVTGSGASIEAARLPNNLVQLTITADPGHEYELQKSTDLATWETLIRVPLQNGKYQHIESMTEPHRFYRLKLLQ